MKVNTTKHQTIIGDIHLLSIESNRYRYVLSDYGASIYEVAYLENDKETMLTITPDSLNDFVSSKCYYGKTVGRTSGRLFSKSFRIGKKSYKVKPFISKDAMLHGGPHGFSFKLFDIKEIIENEHEIIITFHTSMKNLEDDLPGDLTLDVTYIIKPDEITIHYDALSNEETLCNVTNHTYFSLGIEEELIDQSILSISSQKYLKTDEGYHLEMLEDTKSSIFDFYISRTLEDTMDQLKQSAFQGLDHTFLLDDKHEVSIYHPRTNHGVLVKTSYPAVVLYTHNFPDQIPMKFTKTHKKHQGIAIECQYEPSGIHYSKLNHALLEKHQAYHHFISYTFFRHEV
ncbi:MAG: hypothetical protein CVV61_06175 [Tenericutes bacterium HGW-Tenericutes-6]|nr:MAG: hypothetical protein CVV61_06175 [Tenericutes bacterium HGW-Tenericutes-6]